MSYTEKILDQLNSSVILYLFLFILGIHVHLISQLLRNCEVCFGKFIDESINRKSIGS